MTFPPLPELGGSGFESIPAVEGLEARVTAIEDFLNSFGIIIRENTNASTAIGTSDTSICSVSLDIPTRFAERGGWNLYVWAQSDILDSSGGSAGTSNVLTSKVNVNGTQIGQDHAMEFVDYNYMDTRHLSLFEYSIARTDTGTRSVNYSIARSGAPTCSAFRTTVVAMAWFDRTYLPAL